MTDIDTLPDATFVQLPFVAKLMKVSQTTVRRRVARGAIPAPHDYAGCRVWQLGELRRTLAAPDGRRA